MQIAFQTDIPPAVASITTSAASASVAAPANSEYVKLATTVACQYRYGIGAQTALTTDSILTPGESLVIRLPTPANTYTFAAIGAAGLFSITKVNPA